jgi:hypothetical protein
MQFFATPIFFGCMALLIPGLTIAFVLPMIPWVMWIAGGISHYIERFQGDPRLPPRWRRQ